MLGGIRKKITTIFHTTFLDTWHILKETVNHEYRLK